MGTPYCPFFKFYCARPNYTTLDHFRSLQTLGIFESVSNFECSILIHAPIKSLAFYGSALSITSENAFNFLLFLIFNLRQKHRWFREYLFSAKNYNSLRLGIKSIYQKLFQNLQSLDQAFCNALRSRSFSRWIGGLNHAGSGFVRRIPKRFSANDSITRRKILKGLLMVIIGSIFTVFP